MLTYIHPDNIHSCWDFVREGLQRILARSDDTWWPEDVYTQIKCGNYHLHLVEDSQGFVILQPIKGWDCLELFVFAAYIPPGGDVMDAAFSEVKQLAHQMGAKRIKFNSKRGGWQKRAEQLGYTQGYVEYVLDIGA